MPRFSHIFWTVYVALVQRYVGNAKVIIDTTPVSTYSLSTGLSFRPRSLTDRFRTGNRTIASVGQEVIEKVLRSDRRQPNEVVISNVSSTTSLVKVDKHSSVRVVRLLLFLFYCTLGSVMPYIPIYYKYLGIPADQIGFLGSITPAITFLVSPLWGALADITGRHKLIMILTFVGSIIARCSLITRPRSIWVISILVSLSAILNAPVKPLIDAAVLSMLPDKSQYGKSRLYGQLGFGFGSFMVNPFLKDKLHYIFFVHALLTLPTVAVMCLFTLKPQVKQKHDDVVAGLKHALRDTKLLVFFSIVFLIGLSSGVSENFAYVRIAEVGGSHVMGWCRLFSSLAGGPFFWLSGHILNVVGVNSVLSISLLSYVARLVMYASIRSGWQALPAEVLRGATFATFWAGSTYFVYSAAPAGLAATMLGLLNGVYGGIGQSLGSLIGGSLSKRFGISGAFLRWAAVDATMLLLFTLYRLLRL